ncbi:DUF1588 domain-containing protein [Thalassolituus sp. LLYu03]|uniref:DUF1588 domain-containing protein n=1 Tax=Thalassolituus sp. LLYu03 TaxID=3421656 RepID=UPI003D2975F7
MRYSGLILLTTVLAACSPGNQYSGDLISDSQPDNPSSLPDGSGSVCAAEVERFTTGLWSPVLAPACMQCHQSGGAASASAFVLQPSSVSGYLTTNLNVVNQYIATATGRDYLLQKPLNGVVHGGGKVLATGSAGAQAIESWLAGPVETCSDGSGGVSISAFWDNATLLDNSATLRKAALLLAGRLPTATEYSAVADNSDASLKAAVLNLMDADAFGDFLEESANDRLLTNKYTNDRTPALDILYDGGRFPYIESRLAPLQEAVNSATTDEQRQAASEAFGFAWAQTNYAVAKAPLKLIRYVVTQERPYSEVLTADYLMVNPFSNDVYHTGINFTDRNDPDDWRPAYITDGYVHGAIPQAGILTSQMFLARYPSTDTNRNRARARWAYYFFLNTDIEGLAVRSMDPADLADTNNPTLNNPSCAVCHEVMDPVAGAFQNFGDDGFYRDAWDGEDSLPDTYKASDLYQSGDLWYRDMRAPGFAGKSLPSANRDNSLQWLAQQMVADDRFATGTVVFWWPAMFGAEPDVQPTEPSDVDYAEKLARYSEQQRLIGELADAFRDGGYPLKELLADMVLTPVFRASGNNAGEAYGAMGSGSLHSPEQLSRKIQALTGGLWHHTWSADYDLLAQEFYGIYGGIDSDTVVQRAESMNTLMYATAERMSQEMVCERVVAEFELPKNQRTLFTLVEMSDTPQASPALVQAQVNALISRLWGDPHTDLTTEQEAAFNLVAEVWASRVATAPNDWLYVNDTSDDANDEFCLLDWDNDSALKQDPYHTLRSWMALLTYLLSDFRVLYE